MGSKARNRTATQERAKAIQDDILSRNGNLKGGDFTNKEVYLLLLDNIDKKLDEHLKWSHELTEKYVPIVTQQGEILAHVCEGLPDKGFCERQDRLYNEVHPKEKPSLIENVNKICRDLYPANPNEASLPSKVEDMWQGYRLIKYVLGVAVVAMITGFVNLILHP